VSFCKKCRQVVRVTLAGACTVCGLALGTLTAQAQPNSGAAAAPIVLVTPGPAVGPGYPLGSPGDLGDLPHLPEPPPNLDGPPNSVYSTTVATTRVWTPRLLDRDTDDR
jgi:hypothetical protein